MTCLTAPECETIDAAAIIGGFRAHFHRDPDLDNPHDCACLEQMRVFVKRHGRAPDTTTRRDLATLQGIEIETHEEAPHPILSLNGQMLDELARRMSQHPEPDRGLVHRFTPGLYIRELSTPRGVVSISKIHKKEHPFTLSKGRVAIWDGVKWTEFAAPHTGITKPGTRRVSVFLEDTVWTTYHVTNETDLEKIEAELIEPYTPEGMHKGVRA